ncbi:hypothetical protein [Miniimonas sp. S16]|uniref:hypothetical protein n=1 Tax=Miniimonas sp. S16 TaxID=2171623 RepID=UPI000D527228|nr:hypothetical protein [Miniimonas sp. S16]
MQNPRPAARTLLLVPAGLALLAGLDGALLLLGLPAPLRLDRLEDVHGPLMVLGFVGTVIALERAVALRSRLGYAAPVLLGLGGLLLLSPLPNGVSRGVLLAGAVALGLLYVALWRRQPSLPLAVEATGASLGVGAAGLWPAGVAVPFLAPWLVGFLVLTVLGERIELGAVGRRLGPSDTTAPDGVGRPEALALTLALGYAASAALALIAPEVGYRLLGVTLVACLAVVLRLDVARRTVRTTGLPRYMAVAMLAGYAWLAVAGATWLLLGPQWQGRGYDAVLHAVFLGFVISMVMAHAPVILPAVVRRPLPYTPLLYGPLALLHVTLGVRVLAGDAWDLPVAVAVGGVGNIVAVLAFVVLALVSVVRGPRAARAPTPAAAPGLVRA